MTSIKSRKRHSAYVFTLMAILLLLSACARGPSAVIEDRSEYYGASEDTGRAVVTLLAKVEQHEKQTQWERAAALLERALRIEPRNAYLWHRLANVRLQQGRYGMAESLAEKSNALAKDDETLMRRNAELIETARRLSRMNSTAG